MTQDKRLTHGLVLKAPHMQTVHAQYTLTREYIASIGTSGKRLYGDWMKAKGENVSKLDLMDLPSAWAYECVDLQEDPSVHPLMRLRLTINTAMCYHMVNMGDMMGADLEIAQPVLGPSVSSNPWDVFAGPILIGYNAPKALIDPSAHRASPAIQIPYESYVWKHTHAYVVKATPAIFIRELLASEEGYDKLPGNYSDPELMAKPLELAAPLLLGRTQSIVPLAIVKHLTDNTSLGMSMAGIYFNKDLSKPTYYVMNGPLVQGKPTTFVVALYLEALLTVLTVMDFITGREGDKSAIAYEPVIKYLHDTFGQPVSDMIDQLDIGDQLNH